MKASGVIIETTLGTTATTLTLHHLQHHRQHRCPGRPHRLQLNPIDKNEAIPETTETTTGIALLKASVVQPLLLPPPAHQDLHLLPH